MGTVSDYAPAGSEDSTILRIDGDTNMTGASWKNGLALVLDDEGYVLAYGELKDGRFDPPLKIPAGSGGRLQVFPRR